MRLLFVAGLGTLLAGCHFGNSATNFLPAIRPAGIHLTIDTARNGRSIVRGELLAIDSAGLKILTDSATTSRQILEIVYSRIRWVQFQQIDFTFRQSVPPTSAQLARVRPLTRFPQGMTESVLSCLLAAYGIPAVTVVQ